MGLGLRTIIQTEDSLHRTDQLRGQTDTALADAIGGAVKNLLRQGDAKGFLHGSDGSGQLDGAPLRLGSVFLDGEPEFLAKARTSLTAAGSAACCCRYWVRVRRSLPRRLVFSGRLRRTMTETVKTLLERAGFSPVAAARGAFSLPGSTTRCWEEKRADFRSHGEGSPKEKFTTSHSIPVCVPTEVTSHTSLPAAL